PRSWARPSEPARSRTPMRTGAGRRDRWRSPRRGGPAGRQGWARRRSPAAGGGGDGRGVPEGSARRSRPVQPRGAQPGGAQPGAVQVHAVPLQVVQLARDRLVPGSQVGGEELSVTVLVRVLELVERRVLLVEQGPVPGQEVLVDHLIQCHGATPDRRPARRHDSTASSHNPTTAITTRTHGTGRLGSVAEEQGTQGRTTRSRIAHLYRRAGFGARPEELDAAAARGYRVTVDHLLDADATDPGVATMADPTFSKVFGDFMTVRRHRRHEASQMMLWWINRMIAATNPLPEKLTLFWHDRFATSLQKVGSPELMFRQNQLFRTMGAGRFEPLAQAVAKDAAMMVWLDSNSNKRESPNENFARELFELFTLGAGNYSEADVKAAARAFTGWRVSPRTQQFAFAPRLHDGDAKVLFGETGSFGGDDVVRLVTGRPECARFVTAQLWSHFARPVTPDDPLVAELTDAFTPELDVRALLRDMFLHPEFDSASTRTALVK